jgi:hypothetical protein
LPDRKVSGNQKILATKKFLLHRFFLVARKVFPKPGKFLPTKNFYRARTSLDFVKLGIGISGFASDTKIFFYSSIFGAR